VTAEGTRIKNVFKNLTADTYFPAARNAVWSGGLAGKKGQAHWKITIEEGNSDCMDVGLTDRQKFKTMKAFKFSALVYRMGSLTEGITDNAIHFKK